MKESEARQHRRHEDGYPLQQIASDTFQIRRAIVQDADIISWHRARIGRQGTIVNVFTEPQWRRRGIAGRLVKEIIAWSKNECLDRLLLHASDDGRSVYERLGFIAGNEMYFAGVS